jgi:putative glutathione S-transferase
VKDLFSLPVFRKYTFFEFPKNDAKGIFASYLKRIAAQVPYDELWATDGARKALSADPENVFKKHPEGETAEDYQSEISVSKWNAKAQADRNPMIRTLSQDASVNPIASKLRD